MEFSGGSSSVLRKALAACGFKRSAPAMTADLVFGLGRLELDFAASDSRICSIVMMRDLDSGRAQWMSAWVIVFNLPATQTGVAAIGRHAVRFDRILAVQGFGQRARERFQFFKLVAGEKISVPQPSARQRALQQLDALRLRGKLFESHCVLKIGVVSLQPKYQGDSGTASIKMLVVPAISAVPWMRKFAVAPPPASTFPVNTTFCFNV